MPKLWANLTREQLDKTRVYLSNDYMVIDKILAIPGIAVVDRGTKPPILTDDEIIQVVHEYLLPSLVDMRVAQINKMLKAGYVKEVRDD